MTSSIRSCCGSNRAGRNSIHGEITTSCSSAHTDTRSNPISTAGLLSGLSKAHNQRLQEYEAKHNSLPDGEQYLPCIPLYNCRHTFSTSAMKQCQNPALIASITGHSVKTLLQNYVQTESTQQLNLISMLSSGKILTETP